MSKLLQCIFCGVLISFARAQNAPAINNARAASLLGGVGSTTVSGTDVYTTSITFPSGTTIGKIRRKRPSLAKIKGLPN